MAHVPDGGCTPCQTWHRLLSGVDRAEKRGTTQQQQVMMELAAVPDRPAAGMILPSDRQAGRARSIHPARIELATLSVLG